MNWRTAALMLFTLLACTAHAENLELGSGLLTRSGTLEGKFHLSEKKSGDAQLQLTWVDSYGRTVASESRPLHVAGDEVQFKLPLSRGIALINHLEVQLMMDGKEIQGGKGDFVITPDAAWDDYQVIMDYAYKKPEQQAALRDIGFSAGHIQSSATQRPDGATSWYESNFRYYCDQISPAFLSSYHTPAFKPKNKQFLDAKTAFHNNRTDEQILYRKPCFYDKDAKDAALARIKKAVASQMRFKPLFYSTDEAGVAELAAPFDFCYDPRTMTAMRAWLIEKYGNLDAINHEWGTSFSKLEEVKPQTTDQAMLHTDGNYSSWADHRTFMNITFARVLQESSEAAKSVDPDARFGIGGAQMPGAFGGYDYWLLSQAMDAVEPYDIGNSRELWRSFAPQKPCISTAFPTDQYGIWQLWRLFLHGDRGVGFYDEKFTLLTDDAKLTKTAEALAPALREFSSGVGKQFNGMERRNDPIMIHYSHPSITAHWMLECKRLGKAWADRMSSTERRQSEFLKLRQAWIDLIEDNLYQYRFVAYAELENGAFDKMEAKVVFLPQSVAMSKRECDVLRLFVERGGVLVADCRTALMDEHCKTLSKGQLDDLFGIERKDLNYAPGQPGLKPVANPAAFVKLTNGGNLEQMTVVEPTITVTKDAVALFSDSAGAPAVIVKEHGKGRTVYLNALVTPYSGLRTRPEGNALRELISSVLKVAAIAPQYSITRADGQPISGLEVHPWQSGALRVLGLHRNYATRINELGPMEHETQAALEKPLDIALDLGHECAVYNLREKRFLGMQRKVSLSIDRYLPSLLTILNQPVGALAMTAPESAECGQMIEVKLALAGAAEGNCHALRVEVAGPQGNLRCYTQNLFAPGGKGAWNLPFAVNDAPGEYTLQACDIATGVSATHKIKLMAATK
jgi:hypothetical protein